VPDAALPHGNRGLQSVNLGLGPRHQITFT
jgi:hypothetical protein